MVAGECIRKEIQVLALKKTRTRDEVETVLTSLKAYRSLAREKISELTMSSERSPSLEVGDSVWVIDHSNSKSTSATIVDQAEHVVQSGSKRQLGQKCEHVSS